LQDELGNVGDERIGKGAWALEMHNNVEDLQGRRRGRGTTRRSSVLRVCG
jgi:hypothetical protein